jgi:hypothetical protein
MRRLAIVALVLACGCTPMQWEKAEVSGEQLRADQQECQQAAWREAQWRSWSHQTMLGPVFARDATGRGFFLWPSGAMVDPFGHQLMEESRLSQFCMESKGYKLVPAPKQ